ncbi:minor capsid protein [Peptococcus simiae]|uniref:minor capsid protein n=1 Tax=Peptococcus simiae TaxID=1643805 RepID=UPI00397F3130
MTQAYWRRRAEQLEQARNKENKGLVQAIARTYNQALRQIDTEMYSHLSKMADKNHLSPQKAAEALSRGELAGYRMDLETFARRARQAGTLTSQMERELDNASRRVRISRLQAAKDTIRREMQLFYSSYDKDLADHLKKQYSDTYQATLTGLKDTAFIAMPHIDMTLSRLDAAIRKPWAVDGLTFSQRLWKDQATLVNTLHQTLSRQVALSLPPDETVKALVTAFPEKTMRSAIGRLVMTESNAIATAGTQEAYKATGVKQYEIVATLDSKTSTICQEMDGKRFPTSKMEIGATAPPFHPWCRTTTAPYDPDFDDLLPDGPRAARDADGKTYLTNARTYKEWVDTSVDKRYNKDKQLAMNLQLFGYHIPDSKLVKYALDPAKAPDKARAFELALGYTIENWTDLRDQIYEEVKTAKLIKKGDSGYGMRYESLLEIRGANGKIAKVLAAWIEDGENKRLTSVYVVDRRRKEKK